MPGINRVLMCRTRPVLEFEYFQYGGYALRCGRVFDPARVPVGMYVDGKPTPDGVSITRWWRGRGIPATRDGLAGILGAAGVPTTAGMLDRSLGLSLSDQYWVRPTDRDDLDWHAINFFHNDFDERLGRALMAGNPSDTLDMNTPDVTSAGDLPKRWIIQTDGTRSLVKAGRTGQEPDNERIAYLTAMQLGIPHIEYRVATSRGARASVCDNMLTDRQELIPGGQIIRLFPEDTDPRDARSQWIDACHRLGVPLDQANRATDDFLLLDFLLRDTDRHYNNISLIRDVETLQTTPAPIYDSGASLWNGMDPDLIDNSDYPAKPFRLDTAGDKPNALWQLSLVKNWDRYDLHVLDRIPDIARDQLAHNGRLSDKLTGRIALALQDRTRTIRDMRDHATRRRTTTPAQPLPMPDPAKPAACQQTDPPAACLD